MDILGKLRSDLRKCKHFYSVPKIVAKLGDTDQKSRFCSTKFLQNSSTVKAEHRLKSKILTFPGMLRCSMHFGCGQWA
jgi:hypothetical protein